MAYLVELEEHPIRVNARGRWFHGGEPLHPKVEALFQRHVTVDEAGNYIIQLEHRRAPLEVEDTPFFVRSIRCHRQGGELSRVELILSDGSREDLNPHTLMQSEDDHAFYCQITRGGCLVPCRLGTQHYHELAWDMAYEGERAVLHLGGGSYPIATYDPRPRPR